MAGKRSKQSATAIFGNWEFSRANYVIFLVGILDLVLAYVIMARGTTNSFQSLTLAPIMLVIGYLGIIPLAILYRSGANSGKSR
ncbi:MAG: hypothetical protein IIB42_06810 [Candidatus Marinimicrobia bacterium]|nr:hypothetical protein [Candidatus Neomarinimicrobiota bacterium]MCH7859422.1 hypothetical protein [Candidatus Neomarinimicrobiota bacterium]